MLSIAIDADDVLIAELVGDHRLRHVYKEHVDVAGVELEARTVALEDADLGPNRLASRELAHDELADFLVAQELRQHPQRIEQSHRRIGADAAEHDHERKPDA